MPLKIPWPFPPSDNIPRSWIWRSRLTVGAVTAVSIIWLKKLNFPATHNTKILLDACENRPKDTGLVTVANHHSCLDEPLLWGIMPWRFAFKKPHAMRWVTAADNVVFKSKICNKVKFFSLGQCVPIVRGDGVYQFSMDFMMERLNSGQWIHFYPEGFVNKDHEHVRLKWGIGRLISEAKTLPIVIPIWHEGFDDISPNEGFMKYMPRIGKKVTILVGDPIDFSEQLQNLRNSNSDDAEIRTQITDRVQSDMGDLRLKAEELHKDWRKKFQHSVVPRRYTSQN